MAPAVDLHVSAGGEPLPGAHVVLKRDSLPYYGATSWSAVTDAAGHTTFAAEHEMQWVAPLVPHGVPVYAFTVCVEAEGYAAVTRKLKNDAEALSIALQPGSRACEPPPSAPSAATTRPAPVAGQRVLVLDSEFDPAALTWQVSGLVDASPPVAGDRLLLVTSTDPRPAANAATWEVSAIKASALPPAVWRERERAFAEIILRGPSGTIPRAGEAFVGAN